MIDLVARGETEPSSNALYPNLGLQPAINVDAALSN
jgi:hypothetical protein